MTLKFLNIKGHLSWLQQEVNHRNVDRIIHSDKFHMVGKHGSLVPLSMCENIHFLKVHFFYILCVYAATPLFYSCSMAQTESSSVPVSLNFLFCPQFAADLAGVGFSSWESPERRRNYVGEGEQHKANSEALTKRKAKMFQLLKSRYLEWYF